MKIKKKVVVDEKRKACAFAMNKLVRDEVIPDILKHDVEVNYKVLQGDALKSALKDKLNEECKELIEEFDINAKDDFVNEVADVLEVLEAMANLMATNWDEIFSEKEKKYKRKGKFSKGHFVKSVLFPDDYDDFVGTFAERFRRQPVKYPEISIEEFNNEKND